MTEHNEMLTETVLITGASAGIGAALAKQFAKRGYSLVLAARSADKLQYLADTLNQQHGVEIAVEPIDLLKRGAAQKLYSKISERGIEVDILVNNAGLMKYGNFMDQDLSEINHLMRLNNEALVNLTQLFAKPMIERGYGRILNIASNSAFQPIPTLAVYAASKAFVLSLSESLHEELRPHGVTVTAFCPGPTDTSMTQGVANLPTALVADVDDVAAKGLHACLNGVAVKVPGLANQVIVTATRYQPRALVRRAMGISSRWFGQ